MSSTAAKLRLPVNIEVALRATKLPWRARPGSKHIILYLDDQFVGVCSRGKSRDGFKGDQNLVSKIRRKARELTARTASSELKGA